MSNMIILVLHLLTYIIILFHKEQSDQGGITTDEKPAKKGTKKKTKNPSFKLSHSVSKMIILVLHTLL